MAIFPHHLHCKLSADQWALLEQVGQAHDLTFSGAIRQVLDGILDAPVNGDGSPTRRELMHDGEVNITGLGRVEITSVERV